MKLFWNLITIIGLLLVVGAILTFPPLLLTLTLFHEGKMPWNREKEAGISGDI